MLRSFSLCLLAAVSLCASESTLDRVIRQVESRYNGARTLSVEFVERYQALGHERPPESGLLTLRKQGKMRWDYAQPAGKLLVVDGKTIFLYTAQDNRVEKMPVRNTEDMRAPLAFLLGHLDLRKEFQDLSLRVDSGGNWLTARPKGDRMPYEKVQMLVDSAGSIKELNIAGRDGSSLAFSFREERLNLRVDERLFKFAIPADAQVVNSVELGAEGS